MLPKPQTCLSNCIISIAWLVELHICNAWRLARNPDVRKWTEITEEVLEVALLGL